MTNNINHKLLTVFANGDEIGFLTKQKNSGLISFAYAESWLAQSENHPISLSLPLSEQIYQGQLVIDFFANLLPDNIKILKSIATRVGSKSIDAFDLLEKIGKDCVGAFQFLGLGQRPDSLEKLRGKNISDKKIATLLNSLKVFPLGIDSQNEFRISLAGAQEKTALLYHNNKWQLPLGTTPTTHIIKPAIKNIGIIDRMIDFADSIENEHFCLALLNEFALPVAKTKIKNFAGTKALVIERFDRKWLSNKKGKKLIRLPQEDCCQALGFSQMQKYQSDGGPGIIEIMNLLANSDVPQQHRQNFFKANILFLLMAASDGHAKNFSLQHYLGGQFALAPLYDVLSLQPYFDLGLIKNRHLKLAMALGKKANARYSRINYLKGSDIIATAKAANFSQKLVGDIFAELQDTAKTAIEKATNKMPKNFPEQLIESIAAGINSRLKILKI